MGNRGEQMEFFQRESWNFFRRNYGGKNLRECEINPYLAPILEAHPISIDGGSILDVGCGAANNLYNLFNTLRAFALCRVAVRAMTLLDLVLAAAPVGRKRVEVTQPGANHFE